MEHGKPRERRLELSGSGTFPFLWFFFPPWKTRAGGGGGATGDSGSCSSSPLSAEPPFPSFSLSLGWDRCPHRRSHVTPLCSQDKSTLLTSTPGALWSQVGPGPCPPLWPPLLPSPLPFTCSTLSHRPLCCLLNISSCGHRTFELAVPTAGFPSMSHTTCSDHPSMSPPQTGLPDCPSRCPHPQSLHHPLITRAFPLFHYCSSSVLVALTKM